MRTTAGEIFLLNDTNELGQRILVFATNSNVLVIDLYELHRSNDLTHWATRPSPHQIQELQKKQNKQSRNKLEAKPKRIQWMKREEEKNNNKTT